MASDFTLDKYSELCQSLQKNYSTVRVLDYFQDRPAGKVAIMRHDVDKFPERSLAMARLENSLGISSTYYFRMVEDVFQPEMIKEIEGLGHEIGLHYETVDKTRGDVPLALRYFEDDLARLRTVADARTACMHGSPMKKWKNIDIWDGRDFRNHGILAEPYLSTDFEKVAYYTDTGRRWDGGKVAVDDEVPNNIARPVKTTDELIEVIASGEFEEMMILTHPQRWTEGGGQWASELVGQNVKNVGKKFLKRRKK